MCDSDSSSLDLTTLLFICENYAVRGSAFETDLKRLSTGRVKHCSDEGLDQAADWLLVALLALGSKLPSTHPLVREIETLADTAEEELAARGLSSM